MPAFLMVASNGLLVVALDEIPIMYVNARTAESGVSILAPHSELYLGPKGSGQVADEEKGPESRDSIATLLERSNNGDRAASVQFTEQLYAELRRTAHRQMKGQARGHTLQTTALVNEAFVRLFKSKTPEFKDREHFLAVAARTMRHVLVDHARGKRSKKRSRDREVDTALDAIEISYEERALDLIAVHEALEELERLDPRKVRLVELRFFAGRTFQEIAKHLGMSRGDVERQWEFVHTWLYSRLS